MAPRTRTRLDYREGGRSWPNNNPGAQVGPGPVLTGGSTINDQTGPGDCTPLTVTRYYSNGGNVNRVNNGAFSYQFRDYVAAAFRNNLSTFGGHLAIPTEPSAITMATEAAARTNPSRPYVDVPVSVLDVKAGIQSIYRSGERLIDIVRRTGGRWLNYKFMVQPLVGDIVKMLNINDQINRRIREIDKLHSTNGIRRTVSNGTYSAQSSTTKTMQSTGTFISTTFDINTVVRCSTHIRWAPTTQCGLRPSPAVSRALATRAAYGATIDFKTLWEIMPWSWMIDWFGNVGTYLGATRNIIPARLVGVHPMKHTKTLYSGPAYKSGDVSMTAPFWTKETKTRVTSAVLPVAHLPFLNGSQMGILAALAASRA